jgi:nitrate/nitrite transporter NarK
VGTLLYRTRCIYSASPVQGYLTLTLKRLGFSTFDSNMLTIPSAVLQIITMLVLSYSSDYFDERTWHCLFGEFWILPLLAALLAIPDRGRNWPRFSLITLISGCKLLSHSGQFGSVINMYRSLFPSCRLRVDIRKHLRC